MRRPRVFVSSTVHDFRDLRSALKYWLERLGFEVLLSEFNDFTKRLDINSYEACLETVRAVDYFVLLIGSRVGGRYPGTETLSITQKEYRTAYEASTSGGPKLAVFVRDSVWTVREDRKALQSLLRDDLSGRLELDEADVTAIARYRSSIVNDAEMTFAFISEVARAPEMKSAIQGDGPLPPSNWIHTFSTFEEIIEALAVEFGIERSLSRLAVEENLKHELLSILQQLSFKTKKGEVIPVTHFGRPARADYTGGYSDATSYSADHLLWLKMYRMLGASFGQRLPRRALTQAIASGEYLEFDADANNYVSGRIQAAMQSLLADIERLEYLTELLDYRSFEVLDQFSPRGSRSPGTIENRELMKLFAILDCQENVIDGAAVLYHALDTGRDDVLEGLVRRPTSPIRDEADKVEQERPTTTDVAQWVVRRVIETHPLTDG